MSSSPSQAAPTAAAVVIGDEILSGAVVDQNARLLVSELRALGIDLKRIEIVGDSIEAIADAVTRCAAQVRWVFTSGGIGPTHDDLTIPGIAHAFGVSLERDPLLLKLLQVHYGQALTPAQLRLAEVPQGAHVSRNADHPWPLITFRNLFILPGIPSLFATLVETIKPQLSGLPFFVGHVYLRGEESDIADSLASACHAHPKVKIGSYPRWEAADYRILITVESTDLEACRRAVEYICSVTQPLLVRHDSP